MHHKEGKLNILPISDGVYCRKLTKYDKPSKKSESFIEKKKKDDDIISRWEKK